MPPRTHSTCIGGRAYNKATVPYYIYIPIFTVFGFFFCTNSSKCGPCTSSNSHICKFNHKQHTTVSLIVINYNCHHYHPREWVLVSVSAPQAWPQVLVSFLLYLFSIAYRRQYLWTMHTPQTSTDYGVGTKANGGRERSGAGDGVESRDLRCRRVSNPRCVFFFFSLFFFLLIVI